MKFIILVLIFSGCSSYNTGTKRLGEDLVSLDTALDQAQASYLKGCVDAFKILKIPVAFPSCRDMAIDHRKGLNEFMEQDIE